MNDHGFDLIGFVNSSISNPEERIYGRIKLINYIRTITNHGLGRNDPFTVSGDDWKEDKYLTPVLTDDPLLYDLEDDFSDDESQPSSNEKLDVSKLSRDALEALFHRTVDAMKEMKEHYEDQIQKLKTINTKLMIKGMDKVA